MKKDDSGQIRMIIGAWALLTLWPGWLVAQADTKRHLAGAQIIDMGVYRVCPPPGGGWDCETDIAAGHVAFRKSKSGGLLSFILPVPPQYRTTTVTVMLRSLMPYQWRMTEGEALEDLIETYALPEVEMLAGPGKTIERGDVTLTGKAVHFFKFQWSFMSRDESLSFTGDCLVYFYFPPDFNKTHRIFEFQSVFTRADSNLKLFKNPGTNPIHALIDSLEIIDPLQDVPGPDGDLLRAVAAGDMEASRRAVAEGANVDAAASDVTALSLAACKGHGEIVDLLLEKGASIDLADPAAGGAPLHTAIIGCEPELAERLIDRWADVDIRTAAGFTPLMFAAAMGYADLAWRLIECGADANAKNESGETPLMFAANSGALEIVQILLESGADLDAQMSDGWTPLMQALDKDHLDVARSLLDAGAKVNLGSTEGWVPLMVAVFKGHSEFARLLIEAGADINAQTRPTGQTPLQEALFWNRPEIARLLIEAGADVNARAGGMAPLIQASEAGQVEIVRLLLERGADVHAKIGKNMTALKMAKKKKHAEIVKLLEAAGAR